MKGKVYSDLSEKEGAIISSKKLEGKSKNQALMSN